MTTRDDKYEAKLIDRLASTTIRLRNLFYINLLLAGAIFLLVYQDPGFVSEKIGPAMQTLEPIIKLDNHIKTNQTHFDPYQQALGQWLKRIHNLYELDDTLDSSTDPEVENFYSRLEQEFDEGRLELLDELDEIDDIFSGPVQGYFELDLKATDLPHVAGFSVFLYPDYWLPIMQEAANDLIKVIEILPPNSLDWTEPISPLEGPPGDLSWLSLERYNEWLNDSVLENLLDNLPSAEEAFGSFVIIATFCTANGLGLCSIQDIEEWQSRQGADSPGKLEAPGIKVDVTRGLLIPAAPVILLIAAHLFVIQYRRRELLRKELKSGLSRLQLELLDEAWPMGGVVLYTAIAKTAWRQVQSAIMMVFLFVSEAAPFLAVITAGYYFFMQIVLGGIIAQDFADTMEALQVTAMAIDVNLPTTPDAPGLFWEYLWLTVTGVCALILLVSLIQLIRDQCREIFATEAPIRDEE